MTTSRRHRLTKFRADWLDNVDANGTNISEWCTKGKDDFHAYCHFCKCSVPISNSGFSQLNQHVKTQKHIENAEKRKDSSQARFVVDTSGKSISLNMKSKKSGVSTWIMSEEDKICKSEILWIIHLAKSNYSFQSSDSLQVLFQHMFPESDLPRCMQLSSRKISYAISHGLGPYFLKQISDEFAESSPFFTVMYDETLNEQHLKQLDVFVRYWSVRHNGISENYIGSELLGHATAIDISNSILNILRNSKIEIKNLLMLGSDGPNVNKSTFKIIDQEVQALRKFGLVSLGTCNLHIVHNAFGKGITVEPFSNITDFLDNIHCWFAKFPSRKQDLQNTMEKFGTDFLKILRYVSNRWLSITQVAERALELLSVLKVYFLQDLPKENSRLLKNDRYACIKKILESPLTPVYLNFIISVGCVFEDILKLFQEKATLIHILYDELSKLLIKLMRRFVNESALTNKYGEDLVNINVRKEVVHLKYLNVGNNAKNLVNKLSPDLKSEFLANAKEFYINVTLYLQQNLPLKNRLLRNLKILHPLVRKEPSKDTLSSVRCLANVLPQVITENSVDKLTDEWNLYVNDDAISEEWGFDGTWKPIDSYWNNVLAMTNNDQLPKYKYLGFLVKAILTFSHGQASVERGFSINKRMLTSERSSLSIDAITGLRLIKDAVVGKAVNACIITKEMIQFYKDAYSKYKIQKEIERSEKDTKKSQAKEKVPAPPKKDKIVELKEKIDSAQSMIDEGNQRLKNGLKRKCMQEIEAAQVLIDAGNKKLKLAKDKMEKKD